MRKIIHCDADCFFVALEIRDDPDLRGIPVAVGGDPGRRGVVSTCNYEARAFGVHSAMASAQAKRLCPQLILLPHSMEKYREASQQMRRIFLDYSDDIEPLSLDEAFIDVSESHLCLGSATLIAKEIRRRIATEIGITASAGVAVNKFLAKVASDWQKPDGLTVVEPARIRFFLKNLPVTCIPGVGPASAKRLHGRGIFTCHHLQAFSEADLVGEFGQFGQRLYQLSRGDDDRPVKARDRRKSLSVEQTFATDITRCDYAYSVLQQLLAKLQDRLHTMKHKQAIQKCFIKVKFNDFERTTMETQATTLSLNELQRLFDTLWQRYGKPVRLIGIGVRFVEPPALALERQIPLFQDAGQQ
ncbi:MAG: DNA polymerase IV [Pseudomonadota bacterium]